VVHLINPLHVGWINAIKLRLNLIPVNFEMLFRELRYADFPKPLKLLNLMALVGWIRYRLIHPTSMVLFLT
jgi:hypothetical protein